MKILTPPAAITTFLLALGVFVSAAQTVNQKRVAPIGSSQADPFNRAQTVGVAILAGVGKYPLFSGLNQLHYPAIDVDTLAATLKSQRYTVVTLKDSDATKQAVLNAISQAGEALSSENQTVIFFFSGHGFAVNGDNYLATFDSGVHNLASSGLNVKSVEQALAKTPAARRVLWLDACRDEPSKGVGEARSFDNFQAAAGTRLLLSTKAGKVSYEDDQLKQGIFSYYLVKGLQGEAAGPDGLVTFQDLATYVTLHVSARSLETGHVQVPYEAGEASGDFLLARSGPTPIPVNEHEPGSAKVNANDGLSYVWIPPGSFVMGCSPGDYECKDDEQPAHNVSITKGFWLGQTPVTVGAWKRYAKATGKAMPSEPEGVDKSIDPDWRPDLQPIGNVNWQESQAYCEWIGGRLPTEAEWEYAARAGTTGVRYGPLDSIAWYADNSGMQRINSVALPDSDESAGFKQIMENSDHAHSVALKKPNAWNLRDMLGNVWQWTADWYGATYYSQQVSADPQGPSRGKEKVYRGGSCYDRPRDVRVSFRVKDDPMARSETLGFRCVVK